ncbi:MAG: prephenate dehydrogenase/arogenate dehydrogenase family protein [Solirubrobacterales bacterium]|nr:prephenate dehydrogenase/arogenate dehydrogenase family protein [Solirubrobacterales bacterium]
MRIAVLGLGLIGGSIGLAARRRLGATVVGYDPDPAARRAALGHRAIDRDADSVAGAVADAEVVFVAAPVGVLRELVSEVLAAAPADCLVTDTGSVKGMLSDLGDPRFIGGHPIAGSESAGIEAASIGLFKGARWYLTPPPEVNRQLYRRLSWVLSEIGAEPAEISVDEHDQLLAASSHLPHVLANALVTLAPPGADGPSFRDGTRVAGSNSDIWVDIYTANAGQIAAQVDVCIAQLEQVAAWLRAGDAAELRAWNDAAAAARSALREGT